jgi:hypothetical protein
MAINIAVANIVVSFMLLAVFAYIVDYLSIMCVYFAIFIEN